MSDTVWAEIKIGGHIETVEDVEALIESMLEESAAENEEVAKTRLRLIIENGSFLHHEDEMCNYGTFDSLETHVRQFPSLSSITNFGRGGDFDSGSKAIHQGKETSFTGDDRTIERDEIRKLVLAGGLDAVIARLDELDFLEGKCVTKLTASPAVSAWLKIFGEKAA